MIRGTTPTLNFTLPFEISLLENAFITFYQNQKVVIEKELSDCSCDGNTLTLHLTQDDTLNFKARDQVEIQIRALTNEGEALASNIITTYADRILKDGVI